MTIVLRKSTKQFSAGTPVTVRNRDSRHKMNLCDVLGVELHIHDNDLVTRRSFEYVSTRLPRWVRRKEQNAS